MARDDMDPEMLLAAVSEDDMEDEGGSAEEEMVDAAFDALKADDREAFKDALLGLLGL